MKTKRQLDIEELFESLRNRLLDALLEEGDRDADFQNDIIELGQKLWSPVGKIVVGHSKGVAAITLLSMAYTVLHFKGEPPVPVQ
jgi:hypothetical protein